MRALLDLVTTVLFVFELVLTARMLLDWVATGATTSGTAPGVARARTVLHRATEPVLAPLRRALPPVRLAGVALDLSVPALLLGLVVLRSVLP